MFDWMLGSWRTVGFVVASTVLIYLSVVGALRLGERRTLAEMTAYDFVVAVALGSIIGRTATTARPSYVQGLTAVVVLLLCHHLISWLRIRFRTVRHLVERSPITLVHDGEVDPDALRRAHLTTDDLEMVVREHGVRTPADAELVTLETRGAFSVIAGTRSSTSRSERS